MLILLRKAEGICPHCGQSNAGGTCRCTSRSDWSPPKSAAQAEAGNYKKPTLTWRGLTIRVENPAGSVRRGPGWAILMQYDYGYVAGSEAVDGDEVDVYLGPALAFARTVYVVHQRKRGPDEAEVWREYDEDKCMLGFLSEHQARAAYLEHYTDPRFLGPITAMPVDEFVTKVKATREKPAMIKALLLKARDRRDEHTPDLFGTHLEQHVRKDGVVQGYHVAHKTSATVHDSKTQSAAATASENAKPYVSNLINNPPINSKGDAVDEKLEAPDAFKPEAYIKIAADDASKLRADDVFRLFEELPRDAAKFAALQSYLNTVRVDLWDTINEAVDEAWPAKAWTRPNKRDVPEWLVGAVEAKVEKVNRRAQKLGVDGFRLIRGEPFQRKVSRDGEWPERFVTMIPMTIEGPVIKATGGWSLQGRVDFEDGDILVNARPGAELPPRYRSIKPTCDHCKSDRQRNAVFVFQDQDEKYMQVGRQCLQDFMGKSPEAVLWAANEFGGIFDDIDEELGRDGGGAGHEVLRVDEVMTAAALAVRLHGFRSKKYADENGGVPTSSDVFEILFPPRNRPKDTPPPPKPEEEDKAKAATVIDWVRNTWGEKSNQSDYEYNAVTLVEREVVRPRRIGLLTSLIAAYDRAMGEKVERAKRVNAHVGEVGQRRDFVVTYSGENWFDTAFGAMVIARFETPEGLLVYKGGSPFWSDKIKPGDELRITATIKAHDNYKDLKQTLIQRAVLTKDKPAKPPKAAKKKAPEPEPAF